MSLNTVLSAFTSGTAAATASKLTAMVNALNGIQAPWDDYAVTLTSSGTNPTLGNSTLVASYRRVGKTIDFSIMLTIGSTFVVGTGTYVWSLPVTSVDTIPKALGVATLFDASSGSRQGGAVAHFGPNSAFIIPTSAANAVSATAPWAPAAGDIYSLVGRYEAA